MKVFVIYHWHNRKRYYLINFSKEILFSKSDIKKAKEFKTEEEAKRAIEIYKEVTNDKLIITSKKLYVGKTSKGVK